MAAAAKAKRCAAPRDPVMALLTATALALRCYRDGEPVQPHDAIDERWAALEAALDNAPEFPDGEWDRDCWRALLAAAQLTVRVPRNWRGQAAGVLRPAFEISMKLNPEARQRALEGVPDEELPFHLRD